MFCGGLLPDDVSNVRDTKAAATEAQRLAAEQIDAGFGFVALGVWGAALAAVF
jgi:hypothetical protein